MNSVVNIFADSRYVLKVNGKFVSRGPVTFDPRYVMYDSYDITKYLTGIQNVITVMVCHYGEFASNYYPGRPELILNCKIEYSDKEIQYIGTDDTWKCIINSSFRPSPKKSLFKSLLEVYDANYEKTDWESISYDDSDWYNSTVIYEAWHKYFNITKRGIKYLSYNKYSTFELERWGKVRWKDDPFLTLRYMHRKMIEEISLNNEEDLLLHSEEDSAQKKITINRNNNGFSTYVVIDMLKVVAGRIGFKLNASYGDIVDIIFREDDQKGSLGYNFILPLSRTQNMTRYICKDGIQQWQAFDYDSFRYVELIMHNYTKELEIIELWVEEQRY